MEAVFYRYRKDRIMTLCIESFLNARLMAIDGALVIVSVILLPHKRGW